MEAGISDHVWSIAEILQSGEKRKLFDFHGGKVYFFPALKIARLGVQKSCQKDGIDKALLECSIGAAARLSHEMGIGCSFITVHAYPESVSWYVKRDFPAQQAL